MYVGAKLARDAGDSILKDRIAAIAGKPCSHMDPRAKGRGSSDMDQRAQFPLQLIMVAQVQLYQSA